MLLQISIAISYGPTSVGAVIGLSLHNLVLRDQDGCCTHSIARTVVAACMCVHGQQSRAVIMQESKVNTSRADLTTSIGQRL